MIFKMMTPLKYLAEWLYIDQNPLWVGKFKDLGLILRQVMSKDETLTLVASHIDAQYLIKDKTGLFVLESV